MAERKPLADNIKDSVPLQNHWEMFLDWLLEKGELFAQKYRYNLSARVFNLAFDIQEKIIRVRLNSKKLALLRELHVDLEVLSCFLRRCYRKKLFSGSSYEYACTQMQEAGRMVSGWKKYQAGKEHERTEV